METFDQLMAWLLADLPDAVVDEQDGEIVICTGLACTADDRLRPFPESA